MRSDIVPGSIFPDDELPDHTGRLRIRRSTASLGVKWFAPNGAAPNWADQLQNSLACMIPGRTEADLFLLFNADARSVDFSIPVSPAGNIWRLAVDTSRAAPDD